MLRTNAETVARNRARAVYFALAMLVALCVTVMLVHTIRRHYEKRYREMLSSCSLCRYNLQALSIALQLYQQDHGGTLPERLDDLVPRYITGEQPRCPEASGPGDVYAYDPRGLVSEGGRAIIACPRHAGVLGSGEVLVVTKDFKEVTCRSLVDAEP